MSIGLGSVMTGFKPESGIRVSAKLCWCDGNGSNGMGLLCMFCPFHNLYDPQEALGDWMDEWNCPVCQFLEDEPLEPYAVRQFLEAE